MEIDQIPSMQQQQQHPNPLPNPHHRKIELQSPLDLTYLQANIAAAARQKLDLHFPTAAAATTRVETAQAQRDGKERLHDGGAQDTEDPLRARVGALVHQFLDRTFDFASHSISINGNDVRSTSSADLPSAFPTTTSTSSSQINPPYPKPSTSTKSNPQPQPAPEAEREGIHFAYEAYDARLSAKVASLYAELERETLAVSQLRRSAPAAGAKLVVDALSRSIAAEDDTQQQQQELREEVLTLAPPLSEARSEETAEMYERGLADLRRLGAGLGSVGVGAESSTLLRRAGRGGSLTETVGKLQRARDVAVEFE